MMPIPYRLDYVIERTLTSESWSERKTLEVLTGVKLSASEARALWPRILDHKWYMSERLGRDVGLRVAAIDFFENIRQPRIGRVAQRPVAGWLRRMTRPVSGLRAA
ncbi:MAG TPA: DUF4032 domain-containing protein [Blastocatellia bacterium]|nr:DUF4032 domain-containing protein [Blastocatellia bacterium]